MRRFCLLLFSLALWAPSLAAQTRERGPILLELPASTRALAMGNTFFLTGPDPSAVFYQPGVLGGASGLAGSLQRYGPAGRLTTLAAGTSWLGGGVALGVQQLAYGAPASGTVGVGDLLALPSDEGSLRKGGGVGVSETVVSAGYGRTVKGLRIGVVGKLIEERFGPMRGSTAAADLGAAWNTGPVAMGLAVQNLGPDLGIGGGDVPLPVRYTLAGSTRSYPLGPLDVAAGASLGYRVDGDLLPSAGLEVGYWPVSGRTFVGRMGVRQVPDGSSAGIFTVGGAFWGDSIALDYAYQPFDSGAGSHRFGISWR